MRPRDFDDELKAFIMSHPENFTYKQVSFFRLTAVQCDALDRPATPRTQGHDSSSIGTYGTL